MPLAASILVGLFYISCDRALSQILNESYVRRVYSSGVIGVLTLVCGPPSRLSNSDVAHILGNLEEINTFQQMLVQALEDCTK